MHSWKQKKLKSERKKARRKIRRLVAISHAKKEYMDKILQGEKEVKNTGYSSEFLARMKKLIWRNVFRSRI